jgi:hypothetical protein
MQLKFLKSLLESSLYKNDNSENGIAARWIDDHRELVNKLAPLISKCADAETEVGNKELLGKIIKYLQKNGLDEHNAEVVANELQSRYSPLHTSDYVHNIDSANSSPW